MVCALRWNLRALSEDKGGLAVQLLVLRLVPELEIMITTECIVFFASLQALKLS
jgi:hypothetical protein